MNDQSSNSNLEWKKTGFDFNERLTLKTNVAKAIIADKKNKNSGLRKTFVPGSISLPNGILKIRKKIRDVYDDEDDDENCYSLTHVRSFYDFAPKEEDDNSTASLIGALLDEERQILRQMETQKNVQLNQDTGKINALLQADKLMKENGLKGIDKKIMTQNFQELSVNTDFTSKAINEDLQKKLKFKGSRLKDEHAVELMYGVREIKRFAGEQSLTGMKLKDILDIAHNKKKSDQELAKKILEKTGRIEIKGKTIQNPLQKIKNNKKLEEEITQQMKRNAKLNAK